MSQHYLTPLFAPQSIIVFAGPAETPDLQDRNARLLSQALRAQPYDGRLQFLDVNTVGIPAGPAATGVDLAIIVLPPEQVAGALAKAGAMGCRSALVIASGIGQNEAAELNAIAQREGMRLLGPNCQGFQRPHLNLNASMSGPLAKAGSLALISQSGALTSAMLDWASNNAVGFSTVVSLGPSSSVNASAVLDYLAHDGQTQSIIVYLEGIRNARRFMSALRSAAKFKPVVVLKGGHRQTGKEAAQTHSGAIVGSDDVFDAALRRAGAVRVDTFVEVFTAARSLASNYRTAGQRLAIVTNGGGPGVLAADWINQISLQLGRLSPVVAAALKPLLPAPASLSDLIDLSEDAGPEHYKAAITAAGSDPGIDGILVIHAPKADIDAVAVAGVLVEINASLSKPLLSCWMGESSVLAARRQLGAAAIPTFRTPEAAVGAFGNIASFYQNQKLLQQTPPPLSALAKPDLESALLLIESVLAEQRTTLTEMESKSLLSAFHIPVTSTLLARNANEAMMIAEQEGFPVALKINSPDISHKSDVHGVVLNVMNGAAVRDTFEEMLARVERLQPQARIHGVTVQKMVPARHGREINIGLITDDTFGPVITFGAGGAMIEIFNDHVVELPPLNQFLARRLIERSRIDETLGEWQGAGAANKTALERILLRVSEMVCELPQLREMDINPIIVDDSGAVAVDARIVIDALPQSYVPRANNYDHLAILPYPARYEKTWPMPDGGEYTVRPIHPDDAQPIQDFVHKLSNESRYMRFVSSLTELPPPLLASLTLIDYDLEMALVAVLREHRMSAAGDLVETRKIIGVSRYIMNPDQTSCEFSLAVADDFNGMGLGSCLMESIMEVAREKGLKEICGLVLAKNSRMLRLMKTLGFAITPFPDDPDFKLATHAL
ncbi:putative Acetyl-CoA synthetase (ADP-forming) alpha and beta chains [Georgfuchsia toluolica]|uniref:Acetyl-CoA synthetase (ADP-forming) alpha and beta chains n=1 Tax=Georgfuchsia toluolica TaxID=424218 RepID=A0A916J503_9PROT|nr:bifunctional acetate--CoA ligase family protein/GNAT family N-acetyltransferase [Georgfuchsia toluolica]CAG4884015.1 putative Acetyl-CoA synthetase (ADP-forming) alpha and beta chains [Georgfuchsia toluolica]